MLNQVGLVGRLTADPVIKDHKSGKKSALFRLAVDRDSHNEEADFPTIICWDRTAEIAEKYCRKGSFVSIAGRVQTSNYTDKNTGRPIYATQILAQVIHFSFPGNRDLLSNGSSPSPNSGNGYYNQSQPSAPQSQPSTYEDGLAYASDDSEFGNLPF